nr:MAG TPA: hypothetical protein [Caudoviricetes sp.]
MRSVSLLNPSLNSIYIIPYPNRFVYWQNAQCSSTILLCFCANRRRPGPIALL